MTIQHSQYSVSTLLELVLILTVSASSIEASTVVKGVVGSPAILPCDTKNTPNIETVIWKVNTSTIPFLSYTPKDDFIVPPNHDPRYSIVNRTHLAISSLNQSDSATYECSITSLSYPSAIRYSVLLNVIDGCRMWEYNSLITAEPEECKTGVILRYQKQCTFGCPLGYSLVGTSVTECRADGALSGVVPHCESISCSIEVLPPNLFDENHICHAGYLVHTNQTCSFGCQDGYELKGNSSFTVICLESGHLNTSYPTCQKVDEQNGDKNNTSNSSLMALISLAIIPVVIVVSIIIFRYRRKRRKEGDHDVGEGEQGIDADEFCWFLKQQIGEESATKLAILKILQNAERRLKQRLPGKIPKEQVSISQESVHHAFARYVCAVLKCIVSSNEAFADEVTNDIISVTGGKISHSTDKVSVENIPLISVTDGTNGNAHDKNTILYLEVIHGTLVHLLITGRVRLSNSDDRRARTGEIFNAVTSFLKEKYTSEDIEEYGSQKTSTVTSWPTSHGSKGEEDVNFNNIFAQLCIKNLDKCLTIWDEIELRYRVLNILLR